MTEEQMAGIVDAAFEDWFVSDLAQQRLTNVWTRRFLTRRFEDVRDGFERAKEQFPNRPPNPLQLDQLVRKAERERMEEQGIRTQPARPQELTTAELMTLADDFARQAADRRQSIYEIMQGVIAGSVSHEESWARYMEAWASWCQAELNGAKQPQPRYSDYFGGSGMDASMLIRTIAGSPADPAVERRRRARQFEVDEADS